MSRARAGAASRGAASRGAAAGGSTGGVRDARGRAGAAARRSGGNGGSTGGGSAGGVRSGGVRGADPCPCGSGAAFAHCCSPVLDGEPAPTAEALMRSRFSAFVVGDEDHLFRSWHPRTRPPGPYCHAGTRWLSLTVRETVGGGAGAADGEEAVVAFTARFLTGDGRGRIVEDELEERSRFVRRAGRWLYLDAL